MPKKFSSLLAIMGTLLVFSSVARASLIHDYNFSNSSGVVDTVGSDNGTLMNGATISGGTLNLNSASSQYVQFNSYLLPTSGAYSVEITASGVPSTSAYSEMISQGSSGGPGFYIGTNPTTSPSPDIRLGDSLGTINVAFPSSGSNTFLFSSSASGSDLWINGTLVYNTTNFATIGTGGTDTRFGSQFQSYGEYFNGSIASVMIYNTAVTPTTATSNVPEPPMWAVMLVGLMGFSFARFRSRNAF